MTTAFTVRAERPEDAAAVRAVHEAAFAQPDESRIVDAARSNGLITCSLVAAADAGIVGHVLFTPASLTAVGSDDDARSLRAAALGPMAVRPPHQRQGIGSALVRAGLDACALAGIAAVVVVGHPAFYPRFGFRPGRLYGLSCEFPVPDEVFMALELVQGSLGNGRCVVHYSSAFRGAV